MNFVGHVLLASFVSDEPLHGLGAMLPDLAGMARVSLPPHVPLVEVARGVEHHHEVDGWFHDHPLFVTLTRRTRALCDDARLGRGGARAAAHVGVELMLDAVYYERDAARAVYAAALDAALGLDGVRDLGLDDGGAHRLHAMLPKLIEADLPARYQSPTFVAERIVAMCAARPRLRIEPDKTDALADVLRSLGVDVRTAADGLLAPAP